MVARSLKPKLLIGRRADQELLSSAGVRLMDVIAVKESYMPMLLAQYTDHEALARPSGFASAGHQAVRRSGDEGVHAV